MRSRDSAASGGSEPAGKVLGGINEFIVEEARMNSSRRRFFRMAAGAAMLPAASRLARADPYPTHPIRLIVGYTPGGSADLTSRLMGQWLSERLGQSFIIENRPGGGTNIATEAALRAPPLIAVPGERPAPPLMLIILPHPARFMCGTACWAQRT